MTVDFTRARMRRVFSLLAIAAVIGTACSKDKSAPENGPGSSTTTSAAATQAASPSSSNDSTLPLGPVKGVDGLTIGGDCPDPPASADSEIAAQAQATIPIKVGLTLTHTWRPSSGDYDLECLAQITSVDARGVVTSLSCPDVGNTKKKTYWTRRVCRVDLEDSHIYVTQGRRASPEVFRGALEFSLSSASFAALKQGAETRHRYVDFNSKPAQVRNDFDGQMKSQGAGSFDIIINDRKVTLPTIDASVMSKENKQLARAKVLDDARFPFMLEYTIPDKTFSLTFTKVSFPVQGEIEKQLAKDKKVDVYGIYFDFNSDSIRPESEPILSEIASAMNSNKEWTLTINGHTDNIGGDASNLILSKKRSEAVRKALVDRYHVDPTHLSTNGYGASSPKETNDTELGRARNRRVELIRQ
jgi:outer membrane protein OmpA-like peptidoglycan-associated protein